MEHRVYAAPVHGAQWRRRTISLWDGAVVLKKPDGAVAHAFAPVSGGPVGVCDGVASTLPTKDALAATLLVKLGLGGSSTGQVLQSVLEIRAGAEAVFVCFESPALVKTWAERIRALSCGFGPQAGGGVPFRCVEAHEGLNESKTPPADPSMPRTRGREQPASNNAGAEPPPPPPPPFRERRSSPRPAPPAADPPMPTTRGREQPASNNAGAEPPPPPPPPFRERRSSPRPPPQSPPQSPGVFAHSPALLTSPHPTPAAASPRAAPASVSYGTTVFHIYNCSPDPAAAAAAPPQDAVFAPASPDPGAAHQPYHGAPPPAPLPARGYPLAGGAMAGDAACPTAWRVTPPAPRHPASVECGAAPPPPGDLVPPGADVYRSVTKSTPAPAAPPTPLPLGSVGLTPAASGHAGMPRVCVKTPGAAISTPRAEEATPPPYAAEPLPLALESVVRCPPPPADAAASLLRESDAAPSDAAASLLRELQRAERTAAATVAKLRSFGARLDGMVAETATWRAANDVSP